MIGMIILHFKFCGFIFLWVAVGLLTNEEKYCQNKDVEDSDINQNTKWSKKIGRKIFISFLCNYSGGSLL